MRTRVLGIMAAFVALACARVQTEPATGEVDLDVENPAQRGEDWTGSLTGQGPGANITGTFQAMVLDGRTQVSVSLNGAVPNSAHPWHVHEGACNSGGTIVGDSTAYPVLQVGSTGTAAANVDLGLELNEASDYYVDVHASSSDMQTLVACGDLDD